MPTVVRDTDRRIERLRTSQDAQESEYVQLPEISEIHT